MSKITDAFAGKKAFIAYLMAGDPNPAKTREYIVAMAQAGADIIEIGIPFSDPIAEGEVIQEANLRALAANTTIAGIFAMTESLKGEIDAPLLFMTYLNPILNYGRDAFFAKCAACGISGVIIPDLPFEEQAEISDFTKSHGVELISLIAPTSSARIAAIAAKAEGYVYLVSSMGVTGARAEITTDIPALVDEIKRHTDIPVAVGFGVHSPAQARKLRQEADGVIVGSAIVNIIAEHGENAGGRLAAYVREMTE